MIKREDVIYGKKTGDYKTDSYVEIWVRDGDNGFGVCYQHNARGCVWHFLLKELDKDGTGKKYSVHRLAALTFLANPNNLPEVNHIDTDTHNNRLDNLEWCDTLYNI